MILESALLCLALNVYHEARSEMIPGQYAVAQVTMNRAGKPSEVCKTVTAKRQFSWTAKMVKHKDGRFYLKENGLPQDDYAWQKAVRISEVVLAGGIGDMTRGGATYYHTKDVAPVWRHDLVKTVVLGKHIFYRKA